MEKSELRISAMLICGAFLVCLLTANIAAKPIDQTPFTLEDENQLLPSIESRFTFEDDEVDVFKQASESGKFFQGDIKLIKEQRDYLLDNNSLPTRTGWIDESYRWPKDNSGHVIVPYYINPTAQYSKTSLNEFKPNH